MNYKSFEEIPVWQAVIEFAIKVFGFTNKADFRGFGDVKNQFEAAVAQNISQQLFGWIESLKNSEIKGKKNFTEKEKFIKKGEENWSEFKKELEQAQRINIENTRRHEQLKSDKD